MSLRRAAPQPSCQVERSAPTPQTAPVPPWAIACTVSSVVCAALLVGVGLPLLGLALLVVDTAVLALVLVARGR